MNFWENPEFARKLNERAAQIEEATDRRKIDPEDLAKKISSRVIGQDRLAMSVARLIGNRAARKNRRKPICSVFYSGPTGVGKTEFAKAVAAALGDEKAMYRLDCNAIGTKEGGMYPITGSASVYTGSSRGSLVEHLIKYRDQMSVILFDEFEKAVTDENGKSNPNAPLAKMLLNLLDEGRVQTAYDNSVYDATNCVIIMTSNLCQKEMAVASDTIKDPDQLEAACKNILTGHLAPEFLARIDMVSTADKLGRADMARIMALHFNGLCRDHGMEVARVGDGFYDLLLQAAEKLAISTSRDAIRWLGRTCEDEIIDAVNDRKVRKAFVDFRNDRLIVLDATQ
jgi:ATP-dependent Clp protease ATP-binding subunit ClpC